MTSISRSSAFRRFNIKKIVLRSNKTMDVPIGIQFVRKINFWLCPRFQFNKLRCYQASVLLLTYFTYMTYHLTRKPISVVKSVLHQNCSNLIPGPEVNPNDPQWCNWAPFNTPDANTLLGTLDSAFLFSYAAAMFVSGMVAERVDLRYFLSLGMLFSGIFCYLFGIAKSYSIHNIWYYLIVQAGAGICQTTGWPGTVAIVGKWFGNAKKGLIFGIWNSHTSLGNILGTLIAAEYVESDWALSFIYPGLTMGIVGMVVFMFLVPEPRQVGLVLDDRSTPSRCSRRSSIDDEAEVITNDQTANLRPSRHSTNSISASEAEPTEHTSLLSRSNSSAVSMSRALSIPGVIEFALSLFFAKLVSYTFLYWLPLYINSSTNLTPKQSGDLSTLFDVGGILGAILAGVLADTSNAPGLVCVAFYIMCAPTLLLYQWVGSSNYVISVCLLLLSGVLVNGPYALITTAVSAELGTHSSLAGNAQALATVAAIIDGTGSVGAAIGPMLAGVVSSNGSWAHVFYMLIICNFLALLLLLRICKSELVKLRTSRRTSSREVRIE